LTKFHPRSQPARAGSPDKRLSANYRIAESIQNPLTQLGLFNLRLRALRRRVWFKVLSKVERGLIDLVLRTVKKVRSSMLARSLIIIVKKLLNGMENQITRHTRTIGFSLAQRLSRIAQSWGNKSSLMWARDPDFAKFLAICHMNTSAMSKG
jgi:hypothetical protein